MAFTYVNGKERRANICKALGHTDQVRFPDKAAEELSETGKVHCFCIVCKSEYLLELTPEGLERLLARTILD
jgi:hypothetical protein